MNGKYNSSLNIMGGIPDYNSIIEFIIAEYTNTQTSYSSFQFRTEKSLKRFAKAIKDSVLQFANEKNRHLFYSALLSDSFSIKDKLMIVFWQMLYANALFREITEQVFMKAVYQGRSTLTIDDVLSFVRHLKEQNPADMNWSDLTLKTIASKYLTALKKFELAEGNLHKKIRYPVIGSSLFVYFVRWAICVFPENRTIDNPYFRFGFSDRMSLINKLKKIDFIPFWDITQIGDEVTIDIKAYE